MRKLSMKFHTRKLFFQVKSIVRHKISNIEKQKNKIIKDLEKIFNLTMLAKDYKTAIQTKQIIAKLQGLTDEKINRNKEISLTEFTCEDIERLITEAENIQNKQSKFFCKN